MTYFEFEQKQKFIKILIFDKKQKKKTIRVSRIWRFFNKFL